MRNMRQRDNSMMEYPDSKQRVISREDGLRHLLKDSACYLNTEISERDTSNNNNKNNMTPVKHLLSALFVYLGVFGTLIFAQSVSIKTTEYPLKHIIQVMRCQIDCFGKQVEGSGIPQVVSMYDSCIKQCGDDETMQVFTCKITTCQHLAAAYTPPQAETLVHGYFADCVKKFCSLSP